MRGMLVVTMLVLVASVSARAGGDAPAQPTPDSRVERVAARLGVAPEALWPRLLELHARGRPAAADGSQPLATALGRELGIAPARVVDGLRAIRGESRVAVAYALARELRVPIGFVHQALVAGHEDRRGSNAGFDGLGRQIGVGGRRLRAAFERLARDNPAWPAPARRGPRGAILLARALALSPAHVTAGLERLGARDRALWNERRLAFAGELAARLDVDARIIRGLVDALLDPLQRPGRGSGSRP
jgi:hypothetical protein